MSNDILSSPAAGDDSTSMVYPLIVELSYALGRAYQRQGYATEACQVVIEYGFKEMRLPRLTNGVVPENVASSRLCERLGFRQVPNVHPEGIGYVWILDNNMLAGPAKQVCAPCT